jgi:hypothetical protein
MNGKKTTILNGTLLLPLRVGASAQILHNGRTIKTSTVVSIRSISPSGISFETLNTNYTLLLPAPAQTAVVETPAFAAA